MQRRYDGAYQTVLALRQHIDGLCSEAAELRIRIAQQEREAEEADRERRNAEVAAGTRDNSGNLVRIVPTGWQSAASGCEVRDCQLIDRPGKGYLSERTHDESDVICCWYGPGEFHLTLPQMLSVLAACGHIVPAGVQQNQGGQ